MAFAPTDALIDHVNGPHTRNPTPPPPRSAPTPCEGGLLCQDPVLPSGAGFGGWLLALTGRLVCVGGGVQSPNHSVQGSLWRLQERLVEVGSL